MRLRLLWDAVALLAASGLIYVSIEFYNIYGPWKSLAMVPAMLVLGWMAVNLLYPMWYGDDRG